MLILLTNLIVVKILIDTLKKKLTAQLFPKLRSKKQFHGKIKNVFIDLNLRGIICFHYFYIHGRRRFLRFPCRTHYLKYTVPTFLYTFFYFKRTVKQFK